MSYPNPTSGGPPLRALAMVLIALAIVFAGLGAMSMSSADSDGEDSAAPATSTAAAAPTTTTTAARTPTATAEAEKTTVATSATEPPETPLAAPPAPGLDRSVPVQVLNNSLVVGLAGRTADKLAASGWTNVRADNYAAGTIAETTVYYGNSPSDKAAAEAIAAELGAAVAPKSPGLGDGSAGVVVILTGN
ncbi:LytR C-terminal domain-containing protein [Nocardia higoensis]|uniref:LytR C-terminal domain-containing protein n=1 Tax=Nocardia higoensis TaxID=228599 RepID=UPI0002F9DE75|nr:LytR C-terminal domain-containing protein [Nocardia higoensis]